MIILFKILLAHIIGDFILQPASWVRAKEEKKTSAWQFYAHMLVHFGLMVILVARVDFILWALGIAILHGLIDAYKITRPKTANKRTLFFADQAAHIAVIIIVWWLYKGRPIPTAILHNQRLWVFLVTTLCLTTPASITIKTFISKWAPHTEDHLDDSLENAGKYIGILERLLVFIFIMIGQWSGVGFLLAAKSVFRFGDLKEAKDRKLTEYILIGTLLSFGIAILAGIICHGLFLKYR